MVYHSMAAHKKIDDTICSVPKRQSRPQLRAITLVNIPKASSNLGIPINPELGEKLPCFSPVYGIPTNFQCLASATLCNSFHLHHHPILGKS